MAAMIVGVDNLLCEGVKSLLPVGFYAVLVPDTDSDGLFRRFERARPDLLVVVGWPMPPEELFTAYRRMKEVHPEARGIILSDDLRRETLVAAVSAGIDGYLTRDIAAEALRQSIHLVLMGQRAFSGRALDLLLNGDRIGAAVVGATGSGPTLTRRQREILCCLAEGRSNKDIARRLGTSEATVKVQVRSVLRRIGVGNRTQAAIWAIDAGLAGTQKTHSQAGP
jgi:two-component system, NarL family, nitrate/nitrite response regulator NarL